INIKTFETYIISLLNRKLSNNFIATKMMILKDYLKYLSKNNIIKTSLFFDIFDSIKIPKRTVKNQICRKSKEAMEFLENIKRDKFSDRRNILMIMLMSNTGIRRKEAAGINPNAINLNDKTITIYKTKGSKPRIISFSECVKNALIDYLKEREAILKKHDKKSDSLLIKQNGNDLNINTISAIMKKLSKKYNFKITCHSLRRGFATDMAESNTDIYLISKMLGHENINTTVSRYIQVFSSAIKTAMQNHPLSKIESEDKKCEENKSPNSDNLKKEEIILKINSLMEETNKLVKMLEKSA
ncbi:tyrosine-type recombinase/integrase, partial [Brachyspira sp.]|uniref:tyrosine-type recombinase/integrase n=1 Tax=Brachyspira sp. TaxID=1977261 RepID=UPI003D7E76DB